MQKQGDEKNTLIFLIAKLYLKKGYLKIFPLHGALGVRLWKQISILWYIPFAEKKMGCRFSIKFNLAIIFRF
jgi:hypothetical protein